jgi:membrane protease YdiL (CAAX protease family)
MTTDYKPIGDKIKWQFVAIFYLLAFCISGLFNSGFLIPFYQTLTFGYLISDLTYLPACIGTLLAAMLVPIIDKSHKRTIDFLGNNHIKNIATALAPVLAFSVTGLDNSDGYNSHLFAFAFTSVNLTYAVFEEIGWRGYLQDALRPIKEKYSFFIIGILWWAWHFRFNTTFDFTIFPLICIGGSYLIGQFTEKTKSYFTAGGLHCLIILLTNSGDITKSKMIAGGLTILIWVGLSKWRKPEAVKHF